MRTASNETLSKHGDYRCGGKSVNAERTPEKNSGKMRFYLPLKTSSTKKHTGMATLFLFKNKTLYFLADNIDFVGLHNYNDHLNVVWVVLIKEPVALQNKFSRKPHNSKKN